MLERLFRVGRIVGSALLISTVPATVAGQTRSVVSNQLAISQSEAALHLEFDDDAALEIVLRDGSVLVDGVERGRFVRGDAVDTAWRSLLGEIVSLSDGPLGQALRSWEAPASLQGEALRMAQLIDRTLEDALVANAAPAPANGRRAVVIDGSNPDLRQGLEALLSRRDLLGTLGEALQNVDVAAARIHIGDDLVVSSDETIEGTVVVIDADVRVEGRIEGDVVVVGGSLDVADGGRVTGDARLVNATYDGPDGSAVGGRIIRIESDDADLDASAAEVESLENLSVRIRSEVRDEIRNELRRELRDEFEDEQEEGRRGYRPLRAFANGVGNLIGNVITFLLLSLLALGAVYFGKDKLEVVADTAKSDPMRAGMVGLAGAFLVLPAWVLGCVALVASVVGIVALPFWVLLFPIAVALGAGLGYLAVARNIGEWVASRNFNGLEWLRPTNTFYAITAGIGTLLAFSVSANFLEILPFFRFFSGLIAAVGGIATVAVVLIGFGAVLLTRGGREADFYGGSGRFDGAAWGRKTSSEEVLDAEELVDDSSTTGTTEGGGDETEGGGDE